MAGIGPAPKGEGQRRRRNEPARGEWTDFGPLTEPVLPERPGPAPRKPKAKRGQWHPRTIALWNAWREDPVTASYGPADLAAVIELAYLADEFATGGNPELKFQRVSASELRLRMDGLGLTPKGKRDLRVRIVSESTAASPAGEQPVAEVRPLRAV